jgi:hypothetical protein
VPSGCTADDVESSVKLFVQQNFPHKFELLVDPRGCHYTKENRHVEGTGTGTLIVWSLLAVYLLGVILATIYEWKNGSSKWTVKKGMLF